MLGDGSTRSGANT